MDLEQLHRTIRESIQFDAEAVAGKELAKDPNRVRWSFGEDGLLQLDDRIYVPNHADLRLQVLRLFHDHPLAGHFGIN